MGFLYLAGRMEEEELPWDYKANVQARMSGDTVMLDMGTGGGEFLLSLSPPADYNLSQTAGELKAAGFEVLERREYFPELRFKDVGAFVFSPKSLNGNLPAFPWTAALNGCLNCTRLLNGTGTSRAGSIAFYFSA